jgi:hypothetical protein
MRREEEEEAAEEEGCNAEESISQALPHEVDQVCGSGGDYCCVIWVDWRTSTVTFGWSPWLIDV